MKTDRDAQMSRAARRAAGLALALALLVQAGGCSHKAARVPSTEPGTSVTAGPAGGAFSQPGQVGSRGSGSASDENDSASSATDTATAPSGGASSAAGGTTTSTARPVTKSSGASLSPAEAAALEAQLEAIERELDAIALPSDEDFKGIESELP